MCLISLLRHEFFQIVHLNNHDYSFVCSISRMDDFFARVECVCVCVLLLEAN